MHWIAVFKLFQKVPQQTAIFSELIEMLIGLTVLKHTLDAKRDSLSISKVMGTNMTIVIILTNVGYIFVCAKFSNPKLDKHGNNN